MVLIYIGNIKRQDLLRKFGAWGSWERDDKYGGRKGGERRKIHSSIKKQ